MTRKHRHVNRVANSARVDHIIRQSDTYFVARMTDGRVRIGRLGTHSVTSGSDEFRTIAEVANKLDEQGFHDVCKKASDTAACSCPRCVDAD